MANTTPSPALAPFWELQVDIPDGLADDLGGLLIAHGASGTHVHLDQEAPRLHASLGPAPPLGHNNDGTLPQTLRVVRLIADYEGTLAHSEVRERLGAALEDLGLGALAAQARLHRRSDSDWAHAWRKHFKPQKFGRKIWVLPSWEETFSPPVGSIVLRIDPGMAFGTGQHASTAMCLRALESHIEQVQLQTGKVRRVLDVGCGSGILTLGALMLGAHEAVAIDIDPQATRATEENLAAAQLAGRCQVGTQPLAEIEGHFDIVIANILAPTLQAMAADLVRRLAEGGLLLLSGVLAPQAQALDAVMRAAARAQHRHLTAMGMLRMHDWVALRLVAGP